MIKFIHSNPHFKFLENSCVIIYSLLQSVNAASHAAWSLDKTMGKVMHWHNWFYRKEVPHYFQLLFTISCYQTPKQHDTICNHCANWVQLTHHDRLWLRFRVYQRKVLYTKWHHAYFQLTLGSPAKQLSRGNNWNLPVFANKGDRERGMFLHDPVDEMRNVAILSGGPSAKAQVV